MRKDIEKSNVSPRVFISFIEEVSKLSEIEFIGLARLLCVPILNEDKERPFEDILSDILDTFLLLNKKKRKEFLKMVQQANKSKLDALKINCIEKKVEDV